MGINLSCHQDRVNVPLTKYQSVISMTAPSNCDLFSHSLNQVATNQNVMDCELTGE